MLVRRAEAPGKVTRPQEVRGPSWVMKELAKA
jgi:hypothetical protein